MIDKEMENKKIYGNLNGLKVIAAFGIVAMHISSNMGHPLTSDLLTNIISSMTHFVKLFLVLSGFGMCCGYYEKFKNGNVNLEQFYSRRFLKNFPFFALLILIDVLVNFKDVLWRDVFSSLTMSFNLFPTHELSVIGVGWTLGVIFIFYFIFPFYVYLLSNKKRAWLTFFVCIGLNWCCCSYYKDSGIVDGANFLFLSVYFILGGLLYIYKDDIKKMLKKIPCFLSVLVCLVLSAAWFLTPAEEFSVLFTIKTVVLSFVIISVAISYHTNILDNKSTKLLSSLSLEIYLSHMLIFRVLEKIGLTNIKCNRNLLYILIFILTLVLTIVFSYCAKKTIDYLQLKIKNKKWRIK